MQKLYPRNDHKFAATQFYNVMQCAVCTEFMSGQGYQCTGCQYACHPRCYTRVITKCITEDTYKKLKSQGGDLNTGQLLRYNIPHRIDTMTNLSANWCNHCGYILPIGKKIARCTECQKGAHRECAKFLPNFCGLHPDVADKLVAAFEENERKIHERELAEAEIESAKQKEILLIENQNLLAAMASQPQAASVEESSPISKVVPAGMVPARGDSLSYDPSRFGSPQASPTTQPTIHYIPQTASLKSESAPPSPALPRRQEQSRTLPDVQISLNDFHFISVLGRGAFGKVMLATDKVTSQLYAIKALKKEFIIQSDDVKRYLFSYAAPNWKREYFKQLRQRITHSWSTCTHHSRLKNEFTL